MIKEQICRTEILTGNDSLEGGPKLAEIAIWSKNVDRIRQTRPGLKGKHFFPLYILEFSHLFEVNQTFWTISLKACFTC